MPEGYTVVSARVAGGQWNRLGFIHTSNPLAPKALQGWGDFTIQHAAAKYAWAQTIGTAWNTLAANIADTRVDYAAAVATSYLTMAGTIATVNRADNLAVAASTADQMADTATADATYMRSLAPIERNYRIATAQIEREYEIRVADATRNTQTQGQASNQAYQWRTNALLAIDQKYAFDEASLANVQATTLAAIRNETAMEVASSALSRATISANAAKAYADLQAQEQYNLEIEMAGYEKDFAILAASGLASKMSDLSAATPSLWATREVGILHRHVQVRARDRHVRMPGGVADFGQCTSTGQGMADERVPAVVDGQHLKARETEHAARGFEAAAERVARQFPRAAVRS